MNGTIVSVSVNQFVVLVEGVPYTVQLAYGALVTLNGLTCMLSDLLPGDSITASTETEATNLPYASVVTATRDV